MASSNVRRRGTGNPEPHERPATGYGQSRATQRPGVRAIPNPATVRRRGTGNPEPHEGPATQAAWCCRAGRFVTTPWSTSMIVSASARVLARCVIMITVRFST